MKSIRSLRPILPLLLIILAISAGQTALAITVDNSGHAQVDVAGQKSTSTEVIPAGKWVFVGMNYTAGEQKQFRYPSISARVLY